MREIITAFVIDSGVSESMASYVTTTVILIMVAVLVLISDILSRYILIRGVGALFRITSSTWDDVISERGVLKRLAHLIPALIVYVLTPIAFPEDPVISMVLRNGSFIYMVIMTFLIVDSALDSAHDIYNKYDVSKQIPLKGFLQAVKIVLIIIAIILVLAAVTNKTPLYFLSGLGALTAVLMLIFKDAILGFVAGIQLSANNMVRPGDWIEMPQFGADGDVIDVSLTTVKVQNWDKTITTIPAYALISHSFKNWRGMQESGGRRIKRSLFIDMASIKFCDDEMIGRFKKIQILKEYIDGKLSEISVWNESHQIDSSNIVNGRRITNLGTFRAYIEAYLRDHPKIHKDMTFLVRQLDPTDHGIPLEIYVFSNDQVWSNYESIQSDIFDHLLAVVRYFDLRVFQNPSGSDISRLVKEI